MSKDFKNVESGKVERSTRGAALQPKGYGASKGKYIVRPGMDITKPIYEQYIALEASEAVTTKQ